MTDNASPREFSSQLFSQHRELMRFVGELEAWWGQLEQLGIPHFHEMGVRLQPLRRHLADHMAKEEEGGYLAQALAVAPRFSREAKELQQQHGEILSSLDDFIARLEMQEPPFESWQEPHEEFQQILSAIRQHERRENALVQSAFGDDVGTGD